MDTYKTIHQLKELLEQGIISQEEFDEKKMEILFPEEYEEKKRRKQKEKEEREATETNNAILYDKAIRKINNNNAESYREAIAILKDIGDWKDTSILLEKCEKELPEIEIREEKDQRLETARKKLETQTLRNYQEAISDLKELGSWKDSDVVLKNALAKLPEIEEFDAKQKAESVKQKQKKTRTITIATVSIIGIIVFALILTKVIIPANNYKKALAMEKAKQYEDAINAFNELNGYKDSNDHINSCKYNIALGLKSSGKYGDAYLQFTELGNYKDSSDLAKECRYTEATQLGEAGDYATASDYFSELGNYKDSSEQASLMKHQYLVTPFVNASVGDVVKFGTCEQDEDKDNGEEDIEWIVLEKKDGKALLISKKVIFIHEYFEGEDGPIDWKDSDLREYLSSFVNDFSEDEQSIISTEKIETDGKTTEDKIFVLDDYEVEKYLKTDADRRGVMTDYAETDLNVHGNLHYRNVCPWWLRGIKEGSYDKDEYGSYQEAAARNVDEEGKLDEGKLVHYTFGVRPSMWINTN